jgi:hypothetical protein
MIYGKIAFVKNIIVHDPGIIFNSYLGGIRLDKVHGGFFFQPTLGHVIV